MKSIIPIISLLLLALSTSITHGKNPILPPILSQLILKEKQGATFTPAEGVRIITSEAVDKISAVNVDSNDNTVLDVTDDLANSLNTNSILHIIAGVDSRFPFGFTGRIIAINGTTHKQLTVEAVTLAEAFNSYQSNYSNIQLNEASLVDVIMPEAVQASPLASDKMMKMGRSLHRSFRNGAVIVSNTLPDTSMARSSDIVSNATISLNMEVNLASIGSSPTDTFPIGGEASGKFIVSGQMSNITLTNKTDFNLTDGLKSLDIGLEGDLEFDARFEGKLSAKFGYFSRAWDEVKENKFKLLGQRAKVSGLPTDEKQGKFPLAGLVFSVPCLTIGTCPVIKGTTQTPIRCAEAFGVIVWVYLDLEGELGIDGNVHLAKLSPGALNIALRKKENKDLEFHRSLTKKPGPDRFFIAPGIDGRVLLDLTQGVTVDMDLFAGGLYLANVGADLVAKETFEIEGKYSYGCNDFSSEWTWEGNGCFNYSMGAGLILRAAAAFGIEIDTSWDRLDFGTSFAYGVQYPSNDAMKNAGWHGLWYTAVAQNSCDESCGGAVVTSPTTGREWLKCNLGASRVAKSHDDQLSFGDTYQWGRRADGHEKRTSGTTSVLSATIIPGHSNFITTDGREWTTADMNGIWYGSSGTNTPCPSGFRIPSPQEFLDETSTFPTRSPKNYINWMHLPLSACRKYLDGEFYDWQDHMCDAFGEECRGSLNGCYWAAEPWRMGTIWTGLYDVRPEEFQTHFSHYDRTSISHGCSVRCIKD